MTKDEALEQARDLLQATLQADLNNQLPSQLFARGSDTITLKSRIEDFLFAQQDGYDDEDFDDGL